MAVSNPGFDRSPYVGSRLFRDGKMTGQRQENPATVQIYLFLAKKS